MKHLRWFSLYAESTDEKCVPPLFYREKRMFWTGGRHWTRTSDPYRVKVVL